MKRIAFAAGVLLALCGCGSTDPLPVSTGDRVEAELAATWPTAGPGRQVAFSRDGRLAALSDASGRITIRETGAWEVVGELDHAGGATSIVFAKDGSRLFSAGYDATIREWDVRRLRVVRTLTGPKGTLWTMDISPDGRRLAASGEDAVIRVWPLDRPAAPLELRGHTRNVWEVRFRPDGKQLASGSFDNSVRLWDAVSGQALKTLSGHSEAIVGLDYSPDGKLLASGSDDSTIRYWDTADGKPVRTVVNGTHVDKVAFSPDGRWLASGGHPRGGVAELWHEFTGAGGEGNSVRVWRMDDAALVANLRHPDDVIGLAYSPDGRWLVTSGEDSRMRLWRLRHRRG